jgi:hypothetical protein
VNLPNEPAATPPAGPPVAAPAPESRNSTKRLLGAFGYGVFVFTTVTSAIGLVVCLAGVGLLPFLSHIGLPQFPGTFGRTVAGVFVLLFAGELLRSVLKLRSHYRQHGKLSWPA